MFLGHTEIGKGAYEPTLNLFPMARLTFHDYHLCIINRKRPFGASTRGTPQEFASKDVRCMRHAWPKVEQEALRFYPKGAMNFNVAMAIAFRIANKMNKEELKEKL